ncbi:hypothetical protein DL96DRAFT_106175 [Flagelloscypha sp. PMI_526]|nr:hypothetical protein DL96DRAFT_106175 [Flagelloscypha sp. PMI_526]
MKVQPFQVRRLSFFKTRSRTIHHWLDMLNVSQFRVSPLLPPDFCSRFLFQFESALPNLKYLGVHGNAEDWRRLPLKTREVLLKNVFPKMKGVKFEKLYLLPFCGVFKSFTNLHALCLDWISPGHAGASDDCCCSTLLRQNPPALDVLELRGYREFDLDPGYCFSKVLQLSRKKLKTLMLGRSTVEYGGNLVSFFNVFARRFGESLVNVYLGIELCETILAPIVQWGPFAHVQGHFLDLASLPRLEELYIELPPLEDFGPWPVEIQQQKWISQLSPFFLGLAQNFGSAFQQPLTPRCCCPALRLLSFSAASWNPQSLVDNGFQITDSQHEEGSEPTWIAFDDVLAGEILLPELRDVRFEKGLGIFDGLILLLPRSAQKGILSIGDEGREDHSIGIFRYV